MIPPATSSAHEGQEMNQNCLLHGERLTRMETKLEAILDQATRTNGRTGSLESAFSATAAQMATHQAMWITATEERRRLEARIEELEESMGKMKDWRAESRGSSRSMLDLIQRLATIAALLVAAWSAWSSHLQALAAQGVR